MSTEAGDRPSDSSLPPEYDDLLRAFRAVFEDEATPTDIAQDPSGALWAVTGGTIVTANRPYRGLGVVVCSQAVLPDSGTRPYMYRVDVSGPEHTMSFGYGERGGVFLDSVTGEPLSALPDESYAQMTQAIAGTGRGDRAVFEPRYTAEAVARYEIK